jgi:hypothetical protein
MSNEALEKLYHLYFVRVKEMYSVNLVPRDQPQICCEVFLNTECTSRGRSKSLAEVEKKYFCCVKFSTQVLKSM